MLNQVVRVRRGVIAAGMTCPLCNNLLRDATTISLCLHTFCRKCIHKKISDEKLKCCPICEIDLGVVPLEKLRPDHSMQDLISMFFPFKRRKTNAPEAALSFASPARKKERVISSLVVNTPRVFPQMTGRRPRVTARKTLCGSTSSKTLTKFTLRIKQNSTTGEPSSHPVPDKDIEDAKNGINTREGKGKVDLWKPLNCVVEAANRTKSSKFTLPRSASRTEPMYDDEDDEMEGHLQKRKSAIETLDRPSKRTFLSKNASLSDREQCKKALRTALKRSKDAYKIFCKVEQQLENEDRILSVMERRAAETNEKEIELFNLIQSDLERATKVGEDLVAEHSRCLTMIGELSTELNQLKEKEVSFELTIKEKDREIQQLKDALSAMPKEEDIIDKFKKSQDFSSVLAKALSPYFLTIFERSKAFLQENRDGDFDGFRQHELARAKHHLAN